MSKPIILTIDDDAEVLGAIERDLRQHYRKHYRIMKATSGQEALDAARELKARGTPIAMLLADQRMPGMTGVEFLAEARKLHPDARRVLLTAYADTEAAIASINTVALDHYLMKPWHPPEERLYPVLDDLLTEWASRPRAPQQGLRVAGAQWSAASFAVKEFLARNQVPYQWIDIEEDASMRELVSSLVDDATTLPVVFLEDGTHLIEPDPLELAAKVGLRTKAMLPFYDLAIVGAGPAGLAVAVYGASEGKRTLLVECSAPGGQAGTSSMIENYLGFPAGITGEDLTRRATSQARRFGAELLDAQRVVGVRREDPYRFVRFADGTEVSSYCVVLTTGMAVRRLDVPGHDALLGVGVYYGAAMTEGTTYRGRHVCIVGGANSAGQGAMFFARYASRVTMIVRKASLGPWMSNYLVERIKSTPNIDVIFDAEVAEFQGKTGLERVLVRQGEAGTIRELDAAAAFVFIGAAPKSDMVADFVELDEHGFILTGPALPRVNGRPKGWTLERDPFLFETNVPGVFAAGDVRAGSSRRVAAAVGEGSACIHMVIKHLMEV
jgi:thioredoxin reductase (NADPH)